VDGGLVDYIRSITPLARGQANVAVVVVIVDVVVVVVVVVVVIVVVVAVVRERGKNR